jgi:phosphoglycerate dehydrogenase-like enzyme
MKILYLGNANDQTHPWNGEFFKALDKQFAVAFFDPQQPLAEQFRGVDFVLEPGSGTGNRAQIAAAAAAGVKLWQVTTNGLDKVPVDYFLQLGLPLANTPGPQSAVALAEHALFFMFCLAKNIRVSQRAILAGAHDAMINEDLEGRTLGILGLGASGRELARRAVGLDMRVVAVDIAPVPEAAWRGLGVAWCGGLEQLPQLLAEADYVSLHTPLTAQTRHLIDREALRQMKPTACVVNIARGGIIDEAALIEALQAGKLGGAGLDVFEVEPPALDNPLLHMDNVIATPHRAGVTWGTARRRGAAAAENAARVARGEAPLYLVQAVM